MKKIIIFLLFIFTTNLNADVKEAGSDPLPTEMLENIKNSLNNTLQKYKGKEVLFYISFDKEKLQKGEIHWNSGYSSFKKINDKSHKKTYKACLKYGKKKKINDDCYLFAINDKIVWDLSKPYKEKKEKIISYSNQKNELQFLNREDDKINRSLVDREDSTNDHQVHFIYAILKNGKDKEWDINGYIEKLAIKVNENFLKWSSQNKKSNSIGQKFKYDFLQNGKLDVSFARLNLTRKQIDEPDHPNGLIYKELFKQGFNNPKKVYAIISGFNSKHGNSDGGEGGPLFTILYGPAIKSYGSKGMEIVILHELFHTQGAAYDCGKRTYRGAHVKGSDVLGSGDVTTKIDSKNDTYYKHGIEGCPDLADSIFLTPTSKNPWDPYEVFCKKNVGKFTHKKLFSTKDGIDRCKNQRLIDSM
ncbi:hypothetical protein N9E06_00520 [Candidatus Pelagibacter sp.]|jgi:hypothetical protein|nr:hypothetical protein [Candidatus Pelagibacter bacterium]MDA9933031.1 hypothetical protein [Candidatus Pelagibacter sp.]MDA8809227.1 hypothetical protein [Candidatus Pelagibacter bacterium]MDA9978262.1 hypothetical protein [Candidatus Pelagibacter sp.]MDC0926202.1 hypothetical protein [Candidatus Pelagibacter sp.]